jgi:hypothetical protein
MASRSVMRRKIECRGADVVRRSPDCRLDDQGCGLSYWVLAGSDFIWSRRFGSLAGDREVTRGTKVAGILYYLYSP